MLSNRIVEEEDFLYFYREDVDSGEEFLQIVHLTKFDDIVNDHKCVRIDYFMSRIYIFAAISKADEDMALKMWQLNINDTELSSVVIGKTIHVCFLFY